MADTNSALTSTGTTQASVLGALPRDPKARLKKAAHAMEALWLTSMLKESRPKGGMFDKSFASGMFQDMLSEQLGQKIADTGLVGLSDSMSRQLLHTQSEINQQKNAAQHSAAANPASSDASATGNESNG